MIKPKTRKLPVKRALIWIFISTLLVSGSTGMGILYYFHIQELQLNDETSLIKAIDNKGEKLSSEFLAEVLGLSVNKKINLFQFNTDEAKRRLFECSVIASADVKKLKQGSLSIDYALRAPAMRVFDIGNTAIDQHGILFPILPFINEQSLPELYLGFSGDMLTWGRAVNHDTMQLALEILRNEKIPTGLSIKRIDLSRVHSSSYGKREIILVLEAPKNEKWILRLNVDHRNEQLANFLRLRTYMLKNGEGDFPKTVDLRIPSLAFLSH